MNRAIPLSPVNRGRLYLILIVLLFVGPLVLAWLMVGHWRPAGSVHHGELLEPARPLPALELRTLAGESLTLDDLRGRWTLLYLGQAEQCDEACRTSLYKIRQLRLALGQDMSRTQSLLLLPERPAQALDDWLSREHQAMRQAIAPADRQQAIADAFATPDPHAVYLVDPLGNLVMRYGPGADPEGMLEDLERLLKYSRIG